MRGVGCRRACEVGHDLVIHVVVDGHVHLRVVEIDPNDSPCPKT